MDIPIAHDTSPPSSFFWHLPPPSHNKDDVHGVTLHVFFFSSPTYSSYPQTRTRHHHGRTYHGVCDYPGSIRGLQACPLDEGGPEDGKPLYILVPGQVSRTDDDSQGETALEHGETPVGCVLVYDGKIVGRGMNDTNRSMNVGDRLPL